MSSPRPTVLDPLSSAELQAVDPERFQEVERRHALLVEYMALSNLQGLLLVRPENFAWLSAGGDNSRRLSGEPVAALFITPDARLVLCNSVDSLQLFDRELAGLGFQLKERPWTEDRQILCQDLCRGRTVADDLSPLSTTGRDLADLRALLSSEDVRRLKNLAHDLTHAVEATARHCFPGESEAEVAGQLAHRLLKREVSPVTLQVMADGQGRRYRHWSFGPHQIQRYVTISAVGRRFGLHAGVTRTVAFDRPPQELIDWHQHSSLVQATGMSFSRPGWTFDELFARISRIYEKFGEPEEWRASEQAFVIGYTPQELSITPRSDRRLAPSMAVFWKPTVRSAATGDTLLISDDRCEVLTHLDGWPQLPIMVKSESWPRPAILCRETPA